ncbi:MAG: spondin domain-containing protein [Bacteroidales bacterium]|nr:spondin domain-containing protein [Bacteroidales bacterium]
MKKIKFLLGLFLILSIVACNDDDDDKKVESVTYNITFTLNWSSTNFPTDYPSNPHFSPMTGWSHKPGVNHFKLGATATDGLENVAETGSTTPLDSELRTRIANQEGLNFYKGKLYLGGTGTISMQVSVNTTFSAISLITMIAPSPDWYIGIVDVNLIENGEFIQNKTLNAVVYDAGTDDGTTFNSENADTNPRGVISKITTPPLGNGTTVMPVFATVAIEKANQ